MGPSNSRQAFTEDELQEEHNASCKRCKTNRIKGPRYRCTKCSSNHDTCLKCLNETGESRHSYTRVSSNKEDMDEEHSDVTCNNCHATPIKGPLFKCKVCPKVQLCFSCMGRFHTHHNFTRIIELLLPKPWREVDWSTENYDTLLKYADIRKAEKPLSVLLIGHVGSGKSSLINTFYFIDSEVMVSRAISGTFADKSITQLFKIYRGRKWLRNIRLCDTIGIESTPEKGFKESNMLPLLRGHFTQNTKFNEIGNSQMQERIPEDSESRKCHCVVFVIDCSLCLNGSIPSSLIDTIRSLQAILTNDEGGVQRILILTKIDEACAEVKRDITNTFQSVKIKKAVDEAASKTGIPLNFIHPVQNIVNECKNKEQISIPFLLAMKQIVDTAFFLQEPTDYESD